MKRNLAYYKGRKVMIRESIVEMMRAFEFADRRIKQLEKKMLVKK
jgi:hypothetical protein